VPHSALEAVLDRFEAAWRSGSPPRLEDFLTSTELDRRTLLLELVQTDLEYRLKAGQQVRVEDYLTRFPELESDPEDLLQLITAEYGFRRAVGQRPESEEFLARFPRFGQELAARLARGTGPTDGGGTDPDRTGPDVTGAAGPLPSRVGHYLVEGEIARGGMGLVMRLRDEEFQRPLAMKVLLPSVAHAAELIGRFLREARLTGQLQHPGVPPVHELGRLPDGRPYFIMKLIKGQSLHALLKERAAPAQNLSRFVGIFEQVCQTLAYAHARGVIHRDLKPSNIMVGAFGEVQVMDWGLAKVLPNSNEQGLLPESGEEPTTVFGFADTPATSGETATGDVLGTPAYMAPEQARGEVSRLDARCDVFGLGAILCQILTGQPPFAAGRALEQAREGDLADACARLDRCDADAELVHLAKQCLAPNQEERPPDADAAAQAVAQYQQELQQRLRQAEMERAAAQARAEEEQKRRQVEQAKLQEEGKRLRAERQKRRVQLVLAVVVLAAVAAGSAAALWYQQDQAARAARHAVREQGIGDALRQARQARTTLLKQLAEPGGVFILLNRPAEWLQQIATAQAALRRARDLDEGAEVPVGDDLRQQLSELTDLVRQDEADRRLALDLEQVHLDKARIVDGEFNDEGAADAYERAFRTAGFAVRREQVSILAQRIKRSPIREQLLAALDDWTMSVWMVHRDDLAGRLLALARGSDADALRNRVRDLKLWADRAKLAQLAASLRHAPADGKRPVRLSPQLYYVVAWLLSRSSAEGRAWLHQGRAAYPADFWLNLELGNSLVGEKRLDEAAGFFRVAAAVRPHSSAPHCNLGLALKAKGDLDGAIAEYREALTLEPNDSFAHYNLGHALRLKGNLKAASAEYRRAVDLDPKLGAARISLGHTLRALGNLEGALAEYRLAIALNPNDALAHQALGVALADKKDPEGAIRAFRRAVKLNPRNPVAHANLGIALWDNRDPAGAVAAYRQTIALDPSDVKVHFNLGIALWGTGDREGAIAAYRRAVELGSRHVPVHTNLAVALYEKQDFAGAIAAYRRALEIDPGAVQPRVGLGQALLAQGEFAAAAKETQRCLEQLPPGHPLRDFAEQQFRRCQQALQLEHRAHAILLLGQPTSPGEQLDLAQLCYEFRHYPAAARLYAAALTDNPAPGQHLRAACAAALAAAGQGKHAEKLTDADRAKLRRLALEWLRADLKLLTQTIAAHQTATDGEKQPPASPLEKLAGQLHRPGPVDLLAACDRLQQWQQTPDLAGVRHDQELARLPDDEQKDWHQLWSDVRTLQKRAGACFTETRFKGTLQARQKEQGHPVKLQAGKTYIFDLESTAFDPFLRLEDAQGKKLAENDDIEPGVNRNSRIIFSPKEGGTYRLVATAFQGRGRGEYMLSIREMISKKR
jgi:serine/threonine protein kinase/Flp pilus assembly protein TadD